MNSLKASAFFLLTSAMLLTATDASAKEPRKVQVDETALATLSPADQADVLRIAERLETIMLMDRGDLTRQERRALRTETKALKAEADRYNKAAGGTVIYISGAGLLIIIIILLILL